MGEAPADEESNEQVVIDTLEFLARSLVANPDQVSVEVVIDNDRTVFRLHVDPSDLGRIIGRGGRMARAIRQVARTAATRADIHAFIEIAG